MIRSDGRGCPPVSELELLEEGLGAIDDQLRLLVDQEVTRVRDQLDAHVVRVGLVALEQALRDVAVARSEQEQRRDAQATSTPSPASSLAEGALVVAVEVRDRIGALGRPEALDVGVESISVERLADIAAGEDVPRDPPVL